MPHTHSTSSISKASESHELRAFIHSPSIKRGKADFTEPKEIGDGRIESRRMWTTTALNDYLVFPVSDRHWVIENSRHYIIDTIYDEGRRQIRTGHDPVNMTRLRRFAVGLLKSKGGEYQLE